MRIPTFDEAASQIEKDGLIVNVDGSKGDWNSNKFVNSIIDTLKKHNIYNRSFFVLTNKSIRDKVVKNHPECTVSWLYDSKNDISSEIKLVKSYKKALLSISNDQANINVLKLLNKSKIEYQVYGVNNLKRYQYLRDLNVPIIETDDIRPSNINNN